MFEDFESQYKSEGYKNIVGIDEVGRGCLFGDVVACAIIMPMDDKIEGIKDSKKLTEKKRNALYDLILEKCIAVGIGRINSKVIDEVNIKNATHLAMQMAVENLKTKEGVAVVPDLLLIDAESIKTDIDQVGIIKGDDRCYSISCASIIAKVYRDRLCVKWAEKYPNYLIEKHKGYATKEHRHRIVENGVTDMHRISFLKNMGEWK